MSPTGVRFPCGQLMLEGEWHLPSIKAPFPVVIVCHPHPLYGGDMFNNIVVAICQELSRNSVVAFRFNFRGVGNSGGAFGGGVGEQEDVKAALDFILSSPDIDPTKIGLAGYSFGASVALAAAFQDDRVNLLALVSPALSDTNGEQLEEYGKAKFLIVGDADMFIPVERFQSQVADAAEPKQHQIIPGADHSWWGYERELAQQVSRFFTDGFNQS